MTRDQLQTLAQAWMSYWQGAPLDDYEALHAPAFVDHASAGRASDRAAFVQAARDLFAAFPDLVCRIDDLVIDEQAETVAVRWSGAAVQNGDFLGVAPTGRRIAFNGIEIIRCADGLVTERWGEWNGESLLDQLRSPPPA